MSEAAVTADQDRTRTRSGPATPASHARKGWTRSELYRLDKVRRALQRHGATRETARADSEALVLAERYIVQFRQLDPSEQVKHKARHQMADRTRRDVLARAFPPDPRQTAADSAFDRSRRSS